MQRVSIREFRAHISRYVTQAERGESVVLTRGGRDVAILTPAPSDPLELMIATGRLIPPRRPGKLTDEVPIEFGIDAAKLLMLNRGYSEAELDELRRRKASD